jgi:hypothetical protein
MNKATGQKAHATVLCCLRCDNGIISDNTYMLDVVKATYTVGAGF